MAERQETSVMVSIQEILRDAQSREEQEKVEAEQRVRAEEQRRVDEMRRRQEEEEARLRAEADERERRAHEDQRRQAELNAMHEAAVQKAKAEAEAQARLAEMSRRQQHELELHALTQDQGKKKLRTYLYAVGALLLVGAVGGGIAINNAVTKANAAEARARDLEAAKDAVEQQTKKLQFDLENTKDPEKIRELQQQILMQQQKTQDILNQQRQGPATPKAKPAGPSNGPKPTGPKGPCNCAPGDPLCSCVN